LKNLKSKGPPQKPGMGVRESSSKVSPKSEFQVDSARKEPRTGNGGGTNVGA